MTLLILFGAFFLLMALGMPIAFAMGVSSLMALLLVDGVPLVIMVQRIYAALDSWSLLAVPLFIFAGELMTGAKLTGQLVRFTTAYTRGVPAGSATVDLGTSLFFAGVSGSAAADTAAVGSIMIPRLVARGYPPGFASALTSASGNLAPIIPPSIAMIIYAGISGDSVSDLFLGGIGPGLLAALGLVAAVQILNWRFAWERRESYGPLDPALKEMILATAGGLPALMAPIIIVGGILGGIFSATEAGCVAVVYSICYGLLTGRLRLSDIFSVMRRSSHATVQVMLPVTTAILFGWILAREGFAKAIIEVLLTITNGNAWAGALAVIIMILIVGMPIEGLTLLLVFAPILAPVGPQLGFDSVHWGLLIILAMNMAGITPPVGGQIFLTSGIARCTLGQTAKYMWFLLIPWVATILIVLFVPAVVTWIPRNF